MLFAAPLLPAYADSDPLASYQADLTRYFASPAEESATRAALATRPKTEGASLLVEWMRHAVYCRVTAARDTKDQVAKSCQTESLAAADSLIGAHRKNGSRHEPPDAAREAITALGDTMLQHLYDRYEAVSSGLKPVEYGAHRELFAATLIDVVRQETEIAKLYGYASAPERIYAERLGVSEASVKELLDRMGQSGQVLKDYQAIRAPGSYAPPNLDIGTVRSIILKALAPLGPDYVGQFAWLMDPANGAIDLAGGANRYRGGFSQGFPGVPVMLYVGGFDGSFAKMSTIIHEGGHALHRKYMGGLSPYQAEAPKFLAEAVAIFNELLLLDEREKDATSPAERVFYQEKFLDKLAHEIFTSAEEGTLEQGLYDAVPAGNIADAAAIDALNGAILDRYESAAAKEPALAGNWMRKNLLYEDPLYLVNYLYAALVACRFHSMSEADPEGFRIRYLTLLKQGYDAPSDEALRRIMGFGLDADALLDDALRLMRERTKKLEAAYRALPRTNP